MQATNSPQPNGVESPIVVNYKLIANNKPKCHKCNSSDYIIVLFYTVTSKLCNCRKCRISFYADK